jgi:hypothetical protein
MPAQMRVHHFNKCWKQHLDRVKGEKEIQAALRESLEESTPVEEEEHTPTEGGSFSDEGSWSDDDEDAMFEDDEDIDPADFPPSVCVFCSEDLKDLRAVDAYDHRARCLLNHGSDFCPICDMSFRVPGQWHNNEIMWHIHKCQHGLELTEEDRINHAKLHNAWSGRFVAVTRAIERKTTARAGQRVQDHRRKKEQGVTIGTGKYYTGHSPLRAGTSIKDKTMEVSLTKETFGNTTIPMRRFRGSSFSVLDVPNSEEIAFELELEPVLVLTEPYPETNPSPDTGHETIRDVMAQYFPWLSLPAEGNTNMIIAAAPSSSLNPVRNSYQGHAPPGLTRSNENLRVCEAILTD